MVKEDNRENSTGSCVALSGGGHRATLFSLGALLYLVDAQKSTEVQTISSVSGGSITNAFIALLDTPYKTISPQEFDQAAARLASLVAGHRGWWVTSWIIYLMLYIVFVPTDTIYGYSIQWPHQIAAFCSLVLVWSIVIGPRSGGSLWKWWGTWCYIGMLIPLTLSSIAIWWLPVAWYWCLAFMCGVFIMISLRNVIAAKAFGHAIATSLPDSVPASRRNSSVTLAEINPEPQHVFCATEMHAGTHAFFSHDVVYSRGYGLGSPGPFLLRNAVQASANFPGGFPLRIIRSKPFKFELADAGVGISANTKPAKWMILSDGGVFDNMGISWYKEAFNRGMRLHKRLESQFHVELNEIRYRTEKMIGKGSFDEMYPDLPQYHPDIRGPFDERFQHQNNWIKKFTQLKQDLIAVNGASPFKWQAMRRAWLPFLGEPLGFIKVSSVMYNNHTSALALRLKEQINKKVQTGAVIEISDAPPDGPSEIKSLSGDMYRKSEQFIIDRANAAAAYLENGEQIFTAQKDSYYWTINGLNEKSMKVPTTLNPIGQGMTAHLIYHGYLQTMINLHLNMGYPLLNPLPKLADFFPLSQGQPRVTRPTPP